jgi:hypothetical protein
MVAGGRENGRTVRSSNVHDDDGILLETRSEVRSEVSVGVAVYRLI